MPRPPEPLMGALLLGNLALPHTICVSTISTRWTICLKTAQARRTLARTVVRHVMVAAVNGSMIGVQQREIKRLMQNSWCTGVNIV